MKGAIRGWTDIDDGRIKDTHGGDSGDSDTKAVIIRCPRYKSLGTEFISIEFSPCNDLGNYLMAIGIDSPTDCWLTGGYMLVEKGASTYEWQPITRNIYFSTSTLDMVDSYTIQYFCFPVLTYRDKQYNLAEIDVPEGYENLVKWWNDSYNIDSFNTPIPE